jgi:hypothetical protein
MTIDELVDKLAKPIFIFRMARGDTRKGFGREKRLENARREIRLAVEEFMASNQYFNQGR